MSLSIDEIIALGRDPGENGLPNTIWDDLEFARDDMIASQAQAADGATAKIQELEAHISELKARNYDKLMSAPAPGADPSGSEDPEDPEEDEEDEDSKGIDDLFG